MKFKLWIVAVIAMAVLGGLYYGALRTIDDLRGEVSAAYTNIKAYAAERDSLQDEKRAFMFTIDEMKAGNDSINKLLIATQKKLKIKDKEVAYFQYIASTATKTDTIRLRDTVFLEGVKKDTVVGDKWYTLHLGIEYPDKITAEPMFRSKQIVIGRVERETIKPPKKCFIGRWFQRKHKVLIMDVVEENPYSNSEAQRFIQVID